MARPRGKRFPAYALLGNALEVLRRVAAAGPGGTTVPRLVRQLGWHRNTVHRLLRVMETEVPGLEVRLRGAPRPSIYRLKEHRAWSAALRRV